MFLYFEHSILKSCVTESTSKQLRSAGWVKRHEAPPPPREIGSSKKHSDIWWRGQGGCIELHLVSRIWACCRQTEESVIGDRNVGSLTAPVRADWVGPDGVQAATLMNEWMSECMRLHFSRRNESHYLDLQSHQVTSRLLIGCSVFLDLALWNDQVLSLLGVPWPVPLFLDSVFM